MVPAPVILSAAKNQPPPRHSERSEGSAPAPSFRAQRRIRLLRFFPPALVFPPCGLSAAQMPHSLIAVKNRPYPQPEQPIRLLQPPGQILVDGRLGNPEPLRCRPDRGTGFQNVQRQLPGSFIDGICHIRTSQVWFGTAYALPNPEMRERDKTPCEEKAHLERRKKTR